MSQIQVLFMGVDLYDLGYVNDIPQIIERKTFKRDKIGDNNFTLKLNNFDNNFSIGHRKSMLTGQDWMYQPLQIINTDGITVWNGIVSNIRQNQRIKEVYFETNDIIFKKRNDVIEYESSDWETAASAAKNIMDNAGFTDYDLTSINRSDSVLDSNGCYLKCNFNISSNVTLVNALENLGLKSVSDVYTHYGKLYFKHYESFSGGVSLNLNKTTDTRIKSKPIINYLESQMINQYSIDYEGSNGVPATDTANLGLISRNKYGTRSLDTFSTGDNKQIIFEDATSAQYIGETYINMTHHNISTQPQPITKIQFDVDIKFKSYIDLQSYHKLTLDDNGWDEKIFEIFEFRRNEKNRNINIVSYEVNT